jgi:allantoinase
MSVGASYLSYSRRKRGMDHDRYEWSNLFKRVPLEWPGGAKIAFWVMPCLQWFPLQAPKEAQIAVGALDRPYPDYRNYSHRDYGNRVGIFRLMALFDELGLKPTAAVNAAVCTRYPFIIEQARQREWKFIAHGLHMGQIHHSGLSHEQEAGLIDRALEDICGATGEKPKGWLSPGHSESPHTLDLLAERGIEFVCDWVNDDLPYAMKTATGQLHSMPYAHEISDATIIWQNHRSADVFADQVRDYLDYLLGEAGRYGGRILGLALTPWITGQPHRIPAVRQLLHHVHSHAGVWATTAHEILAEFKAQT